MKGNSLGVGLFHNGRKSLKETYIRKDVIVLL